MMLTGQAREDFEKWFNEKCYDSFLEFEDILSNIKDINTIGNALIIEWFDSVNIYVDVRTYRYLYVFTATVRSLTKGEFHIADLKNPYRTRQQATEKAIEKANEIYNEL